MSVLCFQLAPTVPEWQKSQLLHVQVFCCGKILLLLKCTNLMISLIYSNWLTLQAISPIKFFQSTAFFTNVIQLRHFVLVFGKGSLKKTKGIVLQTYLRQKKLNSKTRATALLFFTLYR